MSFLVMEYLEQGQLLEWNDEEWRFYPTKQKDYIQERDLRKIFKDLVEGLEYCKDHVLE